MKFQKSNWHHRLMIIIISIALHVYSLSLAIYVLRYAVADGGMITIELSLRHCS